MTCPFARPLPAGFEERRLALAPGRVVALDERWCSDAIVTLERGELELVSSSGALRRFATGDTLWLTGLGLRELRNPGDVPAELVAVARAAASSPSRPEGLR